MPGEHNDFFSLSQADQAFIRGIAAKWRARNPLEVAVKQSARSEPAAAEPDKQPFANKPASGIATAERGGQSAAKPVQHPTAAELAAGIAKAAHEGCIKAWRDRATHATSSRFNRITGVG
jgi:hypothetical protein